MTFKTSAPQTKVLKNLFDVGKGNFLALLFVRLTNFSKIKKNAGTAITSSQIKCF